MFVFWSFLLRFVSLNFSFWDLDLLYFFSHFFHFLVSVQQPSSIYLQPNQNPFILNPLPSFFYSPLKNLLIAAKLSSNFFLNSFGPVSSSSFFWSTLSFKASKISRSLWISSGVKKISGEVSGVEWVLEDPDPSLSENRKQKFEFEFLFLLKNLELELEFELKDLLALELEFKKGFERRERERSWEEVSIFLRLIDGWEEVEVETSLRVEVSLGFWGAIR